MQNLERTFEVLYPRAFARYQQIQAGGIRFAHYTPAENALKILRSGELWMRKSSCMVDFTETKHGQVCLRTACAREAGIKVRTALEEIFSGFSAQLDRAIDRLTPESFEDTYITCVSEHNLNEDSLGRLSMWRGFGQRLGVALVFKADPFLTAGNSLALYSCPVAYQDHAQFADDFAELARSVRANADFIRELGRDELESKLHQAFRIAVLSTKHPGFHEEREWRITLSPNTEGADVIRKSVEVLGGIPQPIFKIPLKDAGHGYLGVGLADLLDRVIIGPTQYEGAVVEAFEQTLSEIGVRNGSQMISVSNIPLRVS